jgi:hypothetical protein
MDWKNGFKLLYLVSRMARVNISHLVVRVGESSCTNNHTVFPQCNQSIVAGLCLAVVQLVRGNDIAFYCTSPYGVPVTEASQATAI